MRVSLLKPFLISLFLLTFSLSWADGDAFCDNVQSLDPQTVAPGEQTLLLEVTFPEGYKVNDLSPFTMMWQSSTDAAVLGEAATQTVLEPSFPLEVPITLAAGQTLLTGDLVIYYCEHASVGLCLIEQVRLELPVSIEPDAAQGLKAHYELPEPFDIY